MDGFVFQSRRFRSFLQEIKREKAFSFIAVHVSFHRHFWTWNVCMNNSATGRPAVMFIRQLFARSIWKKKKKSSRFLSVFFFFLCLFVSSWIGFNALEPPSNFLLVFFHPLLIYRFLSGCLLFKRFFPSAVGGSDESEGHLQSNQYLQVSITYRKPSSSSTTTVRTVVDLYYAARPAGYKVPTFFLLLLRLLLSIELLFSLVMLAFLSGFGLAQDFRFVCLVVPVGYAAVDGDGVL